MKYKAIMLDLDDTTVLHGKENMPSKRVAETIARAKKRIHVCVATGRTLAMALPVLEHLTLSGPCIITNGTQIYDPVKKKIIYEKPLDPAVVPKVYTVCKRYGFQTFHYDGLEDFEYTGGPVPKKVLSIYIPEVRPDRVDGVVRELSRFVGVNVQKLTAWDKRFLSIDVTHSEASKLHGIVEVARRLKITTAEIIGVGDGYNDFPLLMACGLKIAMGNAVAEVKAIADFIAPTVYEDGVATVIEKFVLNG